MLKGKVFKYGDDINTDVLFPGKYTYTVSDPAEMAQYALEDLDPTFRERVKEGDMIVAGRNFGCGSSREQAATCLKVSGISAVIAASFSRIYFRNAINNGILAITCPEAAEFIEDGAEVELNVEEGYIQVGDKKINFPPIPASVSEILANGGLIAHLKKQLAK
jgi:3-isopropylmalate/(R)-2-methylmalate dehydratase small subunit